MGVFTFVNSLANFHLKSSISFTETIFHKCRGSENGGAIAIFTNSNVQINKTAFIGCVSNCGAVIYVRSNTNVNFDMIFLKNNKNLANNAPGIIVIYNEYNNSLFSNILTKAPNFNDNLFYSEGSYRLINSNISLDCKNHLLRTAYNHACVKRCNLDVSLASSSSYLFNSVNMTINDSFIKIIID